MKRLVVIFFFFLRKIRFRARSVSRTLREFQYFQNSIFISNLIEVAWNFYDFLTLFVPVRCENFNWIKYFREDSFPNKRNNITLKRKRLTDCQHFSTARRKIYCESFAKVSSLKYEKKMFYLFNKTYKILKHLDRKLSKLFEFFITFN